MSDPLLNGSSNVLAPMYPDHGNISAQKSQLAVALPRINTAIASAPGLHRVLGNTNSASTAQMLTPSAIFVETPISPNVVNQNMSFTQNRAQGSASRNNPFGVSPLPRSSLSNATTPSFPPMTSLNASANSKGSPGIQSPLGLTAIFSRTRLAGRQTPTTVPTLAGLDLPLTPLDTRLANAPHSNNLISTAPTVSGTNADATSMFSQLSVSGLTSLTSLTATRHGGSSNSHSNGMWQGTHIPSIGIPPSVPSTGPPTATSTWRGASSPTGLWGHRSPLPPPAPILAPGTVPAGASASGSGSLGTGNSHSSGGSDANDVSLGNITLRNNPGTFSGNNTPGASGVRSSLTGATLYQTAIHNSNGHNGNNIGISGNGGGGANNSSSGSGSGSGSGNNSLVPTSASTHTTLTSTNISSSSGSGAVGGGVGIMSGHMSTMSGNLSGNSSIGNFMGNSGSAGSSSLGNLSGYMGTGMGMSMGRGSGGQSPVDLQTDGVHGSVRTGMSMGGLWALPSSHTSALAHPHAQPLPQGGSEAYVTGSNSGNGSGNGGGYGDGGAHLGGDVYAGGETSRGGGSGVGVDGDMYGSRSTHAHMHAHNTHHPTTSSSTSASVRGRPRGRRAATRETETVPDHYEDDDDAGRKRARVRGQRRVHEAVTLPYADGRGPATGMAAGMGNYSTGLSATGTTVSTISNGNTGIGTSTGTSTYGFMDYPPCDVLQRVKDVLTRDKIKQKQLARELGFSGSTLSPMLKHKYRHTKESHIESLRQWVSERDRLFVQNALSQAAYLAVSAQDIAEALGYSTAEIEAWVSLGLDADQRREIDIGLQQLFSTLRTKRISGEPGSEEEAGDRARSVREKHPFTWVVVKHAYPSLAPGLLPMVVGSLGEFSVYGYEPSAEDLAVARQMVKAEEQEEDRLAQQGGSQDSE